MKNVNFIAGILLFVASFFATPARAYPTLARHGYTTCTTCHYNPSGGGLLTSYGKYIAGELFGTFNDSSSAMPWIVKPEESPKFDAMLMSRVAQTYFDVPQFKKMDFVKMQFDIEAGYVADGWQAIAAVGPRLDSAIEGQNKPETLDVRRFWLGKVTLGYAVRAGKFFPEYGIYYYNHNIPTRRGMYFNHNEEPYNVQGSWFTETFDYTLALLKGAPDTQLDKKNGASGTIAYKTGTQRYGFSYINMSDSETKTDAPGLFAQIGFMEKGYTLAEFDIKNKTNARDKKTTEHLGFFETGWEVYKGVNPYVAFDYASNVTQKTWLKTPKVGLQFHPVTHTELILEVGKRFQNGGATGSQAHAMLNLYF